MSNPIVQIKRGSVTTSSALPGAFDFYQPLLTGELCDIEVDGSHKLFLGNNSYTPILLNPEYTGTITGTNEITGYKIYLNSNEEIYSEGSLQNEIKSSHTITIPPAGENVAVGLITNGNQIIAGDKTFSNTTASSSTTTGAVIIKGGVGIGGNIHAGGSGVFGGDLTVNGGEIKIGPSTEYCTLSYSADTNTLTILFPE